jgi:hypothetical protein
MILQHSGNCIPSSMASIPEDLNLIGTTVRTSDLVFWFTFQTSTVLRIMNLEEKMKKRKRKVRNKSV